MDSNIATVLIGGGVAIGFITLAQNRSAGYTCSIIFLDKIMAMEFTDATFEVEVLKSDVPVLVDFWAPWCGPCRILGPIVEELATEVTTIKIGKMNVDENQAVATEYGIMSIPSIKIFKGGQVVKEFVGVQSKETLAEAIASV